KQFKPWFQLGAEETFEAEAKSAGCSSSGLIRVVMTERLPDDLCKPPKTGFCNRIILRANALLGAVYSSGSRRTKQRILDINCDQYFVDRSFSPWRMDRSEVLQLGPKSDWQSISVPEFPSQ